MNDSVLYFVVYTITCFGIGFALGGLWELRRNIGKLGALKVSFDKKFDELTKLSDRRVTALEYYYERRIADISKCKRCCDDSSCVESSDVA